MLRFAADENFNNDIEGETTTEKSKTDWKRLHPLSTGRRRRWFWI